MPITTALKVHPASVVDGLLHSQAIKINGAIK